MIGGGMSGDWTTFLSDKLLFVALLAGLAFWFDRRPARLKSDLDLRAGKTSLVQDQRFDAFRVLWSLTEPTRAHAAAELTQVKRSALASRMTDWYYGAAAGGMFLSDSGRAQFLAARGSLEGKADDTAVRAAVSDIRSRLKQEAGVCPDDAERLV